MPFSGGGSSGGGGATNAVLYTTQTLNEEDKLIAQSNILSYDWTEGKSFQTNYGSFPGYPGYPLAYQKFTGYDGGTPNQFYYEVTQGISIPNDACPATIVNYWPDHDNSDVYKKIVSKIDPYATNYHVQAEDNNVDYDYFNRAFLDIYPNIVSLESYMQDNTVTAKLKLGDGEGVRIESNGANGFVSRTMNEGLTRDGSYYGANTLDMYMGNDQNYDTFWHRTYVYNDDSGNYVDVQIDPNGHSILTKIDNGFVPFRATRVVTIGGDWSVYTEDAPQEQFTNIQSGWDRGDEEFRNRFVVDTNSADGNRTEIYQTRTTIYLTSNSGTGASVIGLDGSSETIIIRGFKNFINGIANQAAMTVAKEWGPVEDTSDGKVYLVCKNSAGVFKKVELT